MESDTMGKVFDTFTRETLIAMIDDLARAYERVERECAMLRDIPVDTRAQDALELVRYMRDTLREGSIYTHKIMLIKAKRELTPIGLKEAKDWIESL